MATNIETLCRGIQRIAEKNGFKFNTDDWQEGGVYMYGYYAVLLLPDIEELCKSIGISRADIHVCTFGIDIYFSMSWAEKECEY